MKLRAAIIISLLLASCGQMKNKPQRDEMKVADTLIITPSRANMFDRTQLSEAEIKILADFSHKRKLFDDYIKANKLKLFTCPGCGYPTLTRRGEYDICSVCNWEDDYQDDKDADKVHGGPNGKLSLTQNRINIGRILLHNADSLKTKINLDPASVIATIEFYEKENQKIEANISGDEKPNDPIWTDSRKFEQELQIALCNDSH